MDFATFPTELAVASDLALLSPKIEVDFCDVPSEEDRDPLSTEEPLDIKYVIYSGNPVKLEKEDASPLGSDMLTCPECGKNCKDKHSLKMHHKNVHQTRSQFCDVCGKAFVFNSEVQKHKKRVHSGTSKKTVECAKCGNKFRDQGDLKRHLREVHPTKTVKCGECGKSFKTQGVLNKHRLRVHMGEEHWKFECEKCGKKFPFCEDLKNHWWAHNTEKIITCQFCELTFSHPNGLRCHVNSKHKKSKV